MSKCPYTWFVGLFNQNKRNGELSMSQPARHLRVAVIKQGETVVDVALPAQSARWLIDLIPSDVLRTIRDEGIPIDQIQTDLANNQQLCQQNIFSLCEPHRNVEVWLE